MYYIYILDNETAATQLSFLLVCKFTLLITVPYSALHSTSFHFFSFLFSDSAVLLVLVTKNVVASWEFIGFLKLHTSFFFFFFLFFFQKSQSNIFLSNYCTNRGTNRAYVLRRFITQQKNLIFIYESISYVFSKRFKKSILNDEYKWSLSHSYYSTLGNIVKHIHIYI